MEQEKHDLFVVASDETIKEALVKIERNDFGTVIIVNHDNKVVGSLTDGDVRKSLIRGHTLLMPVSDVMNTGFHFVIQGQEAKDCEAVFAEFPYIKLIPVIDDAGVLVDLCLRN